METTMETALRKRLVESGATQTEVAEASGVAQATVGRFLRGESNITVRNFEAINRFLQERESLAMAGLLPQKARRV